MKIAAVAFALLLQAQDVRIRRIAQTQDPLASQQASQLHLLRQHGAPAKR